MLLATEKLFSVWWARYNGVAEDPSKVGFVAVDPHTLEIHFKTPTDINAFLALDSTRIYALPKHLLKEADPAKLDADPIFQKPIGTGCYIIDNQVSCERYELTANEDYFLGHPTSISLLSVLWMLPVLSSLMSGDRPHKCTGRGSFGRLDLIQDADGIKPAGVQSYGYQYMTINCSKEHFKDARCVEHSVWRLTVRIS